MAAGGVGDIVSGNVAVDVTVSTATMHMSRGVYIGTSGNWDFNVGGAWVAFKNTLAGSIIPICAIGARVTAGGAAPTTGDIVFLY